MSDGELFAGVRALKKPRLDQMLSAHHTTDRTAAVAACIYVETAFFLDWVREFHPRPQAVGKRTLVLS